MQLQIVTDSSADLPKEIINKYSIEVVPLSIQIKNETFLDQVEINNETFYKSLESSKEMPKTSRPAPAYYVDVFEKLSKKGPIVCITLSSGLSGSYESAVLAKSMVNAKIEIIDSLNASLGTGMNVIKACDLREEGKSFEEIVEKVITYRDNLNTFFTIDTLEYIVKGGRLSSWEGAIGQVFDIKPILYNLPDGTIGTLEKVRGRKKALKKLVKLVEETGKDFTKIKIGISHTKCLSEALEIKAILNESLKPQEIIISELGPTIGAHTGLGAILIAL
ncbi:EDD domain protein, DegV family [Desulfonispora thiosulfatigenes DSM 11270]|uniref:EDD domain protein, DegV family n=1 Tax=Desulfonispora thiosulfatigenes DSM 11270 TaxID=656914 RepID=A0A1W1VT18_DESTI|nr:DegV family protein [Desulfonispora thiosulfatigenes]SMB96498.1 EDD domain protein, DegV family [Desulfonispora thiosulfatigenes DSM 11270]